MKILRTRPQDPIRRAPPSYAPEGTVVWVVFGFAVIVLLYWLGVI